MSFSTACYLGLDIGGTGVKAGVVDAAGHLLGFAHRGYSPETPAPGQAQIAIGIIEQAAKAVVREAVAAAGRPIRAMAISSQGQTFVPLDVHDRPLHPAILWYDSRAALQATALREQLAAHAGDPDCPTVTPIASAAKIAWLHASVPGLRENAVRYLLLPDYFTYRLCGQAVSDPNTAASTGLCHTGAGSYFQSALDAVGLTTDQLAVVQASASPIGPIFKTAAAEWGISPETLLITGTNDQYAGALGAGNCVPGIVSATTGTCLALVTLTPQLPDPLPAGLLHGVFPLKPYRFVLAYTKTAGIVLDWFRREFAPAASPSEMDRLADAVPIGCDGLTALPHFDGMVSPNPNPAMRGLFAGLTLRHGRDAMYRALMESIAFCLRDNLEAMQRTGLPINTIRAIGGAAKSDIWLQMQADVARTPVEQPDVTEAAVMGAAMLAATGCGDFDSLADCSQRLYRVKTVFVPRPETREPYDVAYRAYQQWMTRATAKFDS